MDISRRSFGKGLLGAVAAVAGLTRSSEIRGAGGNLRGEELSKEKVPESTINLSTSAAEVVGTVLKIKPAEGSFRSFVLRLRVNREELTAMACGKQAQKLEELRASGKLREGRQVHLFGYLEATARSGWIKIEQLQVLEA